ncbi:MAG: hypothetical protein HN929_06325 [Chloroflexi bacterium]|nr:hypothetical protein [Chloroflexota bacterium]
MTNTIALDATTEQIITAGNNLTLNNTLTLSDGAITSTGGTVVLNTANITGGTIDITGTTITQSNNVSLVLSTVTSNSATVWNIGAGFTLTLTGTSGSIDGTINIPAAAILTAAATGTADIDADIVLNGGTLDINEDTSVTSSSTITHTTGSIIDIADTKTLTYEGTAINIDALILTLTSAGTAYFTNTNALILNHVNSRLLITGSITINNVSVTANSAGGDGIDVDSGDAIISDLYASADPRVDVAGGATLTIGNSFSVTSNATLTVSGAGTLTLGDIILFASLDIDGTVALSSDATLFAKGADVTFGAGSDLTFGDGVVVDDGSILRIADTDGGVTATVTFEGGITIAGTGQIILEDDENLTLQFPTPDADTMAKITDNGGTLTPEQPITGFAAAANAISGVIELSWTNSASVNVYICKSTLGYLSVPCTSGDIYNLTGDSTDDTGLTDGTTYFYTAFSYSGAPATPPTSTLATAQASAVPANGTTYTDVTGFTAQPRDSKIILSWTNPAANFDSVIVRRSTSGYPVDQSADVSVYSGTAETYTDTGLSNGTIYFYRVFAVSTISPTYASGVNAVAAPTIIPTGLVSYYPLKGNENDGSGQGNHGSESGSPTNTTNIFDESNSAYLFDGSDDYIEISNPVEDDFSLSLWLKTTQVSGVANTNWYDGKELIESYQGTLYKDFGVTVGQAGEILFGNTQDDGSANTLVGSVISDDEWHNITVTRSQSLGTTKLYVDSTLADSSTSAGTLSLNSSQLLQIGRQDSAGQFYSGKLDEIRIYNRPITTTEIARLYFSFASKAEANISSNQYHTCVLIDGGTINCWGVGGGASFGRLGDASTSTGPTPVAVATISNALQLSVGEDHSCAVLDNGQVWCWGEGSNGKLGDASTDVRTTPVQVSNISSALQVAAGDEHTCAVIDNSSGSTIQCWGLADNGRLGNNQDSGTFTYPNGAFTEVTSITNAVQVGVGSDFSCALGSDRKVLCWGSGTEGRLGNGQTTEYKTPVYVNTTQISTAIQISVGNSHACALLADGTIKCWGSDSEAKMGNAADQADDTNSTPVLVSNITTAIQISAGKSHTCALLINGSVECWGNNDVGQLGNGTPSASELIPVSVGGLGSNAVHVSAGERFTCATLTTGAVQCWGYGIDGRLGNGVANSSTPLTVGTINTAKQ